MSKIKKQGGVWSTNCLTSIGAAHRALSYLYNGLQKDDAWVSTLADDALYPTPESWTFSEAAKTFMQHCQRLSNKLSSPTEVSVMLPLGKLLTLVSRSLNITFTDVRNVPSLSELLEFLPKIHKTALSILSYLILCCGTNLLPKSKFILDLCLQVLVSTERMDEQSKSEVRASVYCVLSLWLEMTGLGTHYMTKAKDFHRELISDIMQTQNSSVQPENGLQSDRTETDHPHKKKGKGKGKKKGSRRAQSYLESDYANAAKGGGTAETKTPLRVSSTLGALQVSRLVAERSQFLPMQGLMRSVLDTATTLQRQPAAETSPYADTKCRCSLYRTVFTFASVPLGKVTSSSLTVSHFQLTSRAISVVMQAGIRDPSVEVQRVCQNLISSCKSIGVVDRPIVRKIMLDEQKETRNVDEMDTQMEDLKEENELLKRKLFETQMESKSKSTQVSQLQEELAAITKKHEEEPEEEDNEDDDEEEIDEASTDNVENHEKVDSEDNGDKESKTSSKLQGNNTSQSSLQAMDVEESDEDKANEKDETARHDSFVNGQVQSKSESSKQDISPNVGKSEKKRSAKTSPHVESSAEKLSRLDSHQDEQSEEVKMMLLDFVDAGPDSD